MQNGIGLIADKDIALAIREDDLSDLAMDILTISEEVTEIFSKVDSKMDSLKNCYEADEYNMLMVKYRDFKKNYSVVKDNIVSYSDDLISVINKVRAGDKNIAFIIDSITDDAKDKARKIEKM